MLCCLDGSAPETASALHHYGGAAVFGETPLCEAECVPCNAEHGMCKFWCGYTETIVPADSAETTKTVDTGSAATPIFMSDKSFGIHEAWALRWAYRLYAHRASFQGEAQIVHAVEPDVTLPCLRENLESAWVRFQLWKRAVEAGKQEVLAASLLQLPLEELLSSAAEWYGEHVRRRRLEAWRTSGDRLDICCMDGNAKLYRRTCGTPCAEVFHCRALDLHLVRGCSESPQQKGVLCARYQDLASTPTLVAQIEGHCVRAALSASPFLEVDVRPTGHHRWQLASTIASDTVQAYFANCGEQVVQDRRRKKQERRDLARNPTKFLLGDWSSQASKRKCTCKTHKESMAAVRTASRSAGFLTAVSESGIIGALHEVITAETLSQRYCFLAQVAADMPELQTLVHDDACHVRVFSLCQATGAPAGSLTERLSQLRFVIDRPHSRGHVDSACRAHCFPTVPANAAALGTFPTPICESVNAQLSPLAHTVHHMGRWTCFFLVSECVEVHNELLCRKRSQKRLRGERSVASLQQPALVAPVVRRKLLPLWSAAAASGETFFECHMNKARSRNQLAFACHGARIIFGDKYVAGVAVCASGAQRKCAGEAQEALLAQVPAHLQDKLKAFWAEATSVDVVQMETIYDVRALEITWSDLEEILHVAPMRQNMGFPKYKGAELHQHLEALCQRPGVVVRRASGLIAS